MTKRKLTFISYLGGLLDVRVRGYGIQARVRPWPWMAFVTPRHLSLYEVIGIVNGAWYFMAEPPRASVVPLEEYRQRRK